MSIYVWQRNPHRLIALFYDVDRVEIGEQSDPYSKDFAHHVYNTDGRVRVGIISGCDWSTEWY